jgi:hypothetical protein
MGKRSKPSNERGPLIRWVAWGRELTNRGKHSNILALHDGRGSSAVEQGTHKPLVVGSNPTLATPLFSNPPANEPSG